MPLLARRLQVALPLTGLLLLGSLGVLPGFGQGMDRRQVTALLLLALPVVAWCGGPFLRSLGRPVRDGLLAVGVAASFAGSILVAWGQDAFGEPLLFGQAALLVSAGLLGDWLEARARRPLPDLGLPRSARTLRDGIEMGLRPEDVLAGERVEVRPGERAPVDGVLVEGESAFDEALFTGDTMPVERGPGAPVLAGFLNRTATVVLETTCAGSESTAPRLLRAAAGARRPSLREPTDAAARRFLPLALAGGAAALMLGWPASLSVLATATPAALPLAVPFLVLAASRRASELGLEVRNGEALDVAARLVSVVGPVPGLRGLGLQVHPEGTPVAALTRPVALVFTGLPDEADLAAADVAVSLGRGPLAGALADVGARSPADVETLVELARATRASGRRALAAVLLPPALALPLAAGALDGASLMDLAVPGGATLVSLALLGAVGTALRRVRVGSGAPPGEAGAPFGAG